MHPALFALVRVLEILTSPVALTPSWSKNAIKLENLDCLAYLFPWVSEAGEDEAL
jgi:hypothetical protein